MTFYILKTGEERLTINLYWIIYVATKNRRLYNYRHNILSCGSIEFCAGYGQMEISTD